jgi:hypothetical protein
MCVILWNEALKGSAGDIKTAEYSCNPEGCNCHLLVMRVAHKVPSWIRGMTQLKFV